MSWLKKITVQKILCVFAVGVFFLGIHWREAVAASAEASKKENCNFCEGYAVLEKAMNLHPAPKDDEMQNMDHANVKKLADKVLNQILSESPELQGKASVYFVKTMAKASPYDPGNELVSNHWDKIKPRLKNIEKDLAQLVQGQQVTKSEADRFRQAVAVQEGIILEGNGK